MDDQSALPSVRGVPAWAAVAIGCFGAIVGLAIDHVIGSGELTARFAVIYVLACTLAALAVQHRSLFTAVVQPPIILFIAVPLAYVLLGSASLSVRAIALNVIPLVNRFPLMLFATTVVMVIGAVRLVRNRPRAVRSPDRRATAATERKQRGDRTASKAATPAATPPADLESAETVRIAAATRRRASPGSRSVGGTSATAGSAGHAAGRTRPAAGTAHPAAAQPEPTPIEAPGASAGGWLATVNPLVPRRDDRPSPEERELSDLDAEEARRSPRRNARRSEMSAASAPHGPVRYRPDSVAPRGSGRRDPDGAPAEPVFDDAALSAARRTRSGRRFQPEPRLPEHPIPSVRYRGEPPLGF